MYSDLTTSKEVIGSKDKITSLDLSSDGNKLAGSSENGNIYIWDVRHNYAATTYSITKKRKLLAISFMPDDRQVVVGDETGLIRIVDSGLVIRNLSGHTSPIEQIKFNWSGKFMATASKDGSIRLWNKDELSQPPQVLSDHTWIWNVAFTPDDQQLMAGLHTKEQTADGSVNESIRVWPTLVPTMSSQLCGLINRNMTHADWVLYMGKLPYEKNLSQLSRQQQ